MNKRSKVAVFFSALALVVGSGCYYDNYEDMYQYLPDETCDTPPSSYSSDIQPWIDAQCVSCHGTSSPSGGLDLTTYDNVSTNAASILNRISLAESDPSFMPQGGSALSDCNISGFSAWIDLGTPNN